MTSVYDTINDDNLLKEIWEDMVADEELMRQSEL